jgi:hypothetical protein
MVYRRRLSCPGFGPSCSYSQERGGYSFSWVLVDSGSLRRPESKFIMVQKDVHGRSFQSGTPALAAPGIIPALNLLVRDAAPAIKRSYRLPNARYLPIRSRRGTRGARRLREKIGYRRALRYSFRNASPQFRHEASMLSRPCVFSRRCAGRGQLRMAMMAEGRITNNLSRLRA